MKGKVDVIVYFAGIIFIGLIFGSIIFGGIIWFTGEVNQNFDWQPKEEPKTIKLSGWDFVDSAVPESHKKDLETVVGATCLKWSEPFCGQELHIADFCQEILDNNGRVGIVGFDYNKELISEVGLLSLDENEFYHDSNHGILIVVDVSCPEVCETGYLVQCLSWRFENA